MATEPCRIVERPVGLFWFNAQATLASGLTPDQAYARLQQALPRIVVAPDEGILLPVKRLYTGYVRNGSFSLSGPWGRHADAKLHVRGTIEPRGSGSLIHLTIYPARSLFAFSALWASAVLLVGIWWFLDGYFSVTPLFPAAGLGLLGFLTYALGLIGVSRQLAFLLNRLQALFSGGSVPQASRHQQELPNAGPPPVPPIADPMWSTRAVLQLTVLFLVGGVGVLVSCVAIPLMFVAPVWHERQTAQRMVETHCLILESRLREESHAVTRTKRRSGRNEQVPTGEIHYTYRPEFLIRYEVVGKSYETWAYRLPSFAGFSSRGSAEDKLRQFVAGQEHPCWYDPDQPKTVVLERTTGMLPALAAGMFFSGIFLVPSAAAIVIAFLILRRVRGARSLTRATVS